MSSSVTDFRNTQQQLANHLRNPQCPPPEGIEDRRLAIYRDLIFNNIESFLAGGFPILKTLYSDDEWQDLVRTFIVEHRAETPYFLEIGEEFFQFLQSRYDSQGTDPGFILELAHYEWVELALDVSEEEFPDTPLTVNVLEDVPLVSPLVWKLSYQYPVHQLGKDYQPSEPPANPTFLLVYRDREDRVRFMESNALTVSLLNRLESGMTGKAALIEMAEELKHPDPNSFLLMGEELLLKLQNHDILI